MITVYDNPAYYEIAFSFRDIVKEVDVFEACIDHFSRIPVRSVLEVACGNCPHLEELTRRGYRYVGVDNSEAMLAFSRKKAERMGAAALLLKADMASFTIPVQVDFVFVALGSWFFRTTDDMISHLNSVTQSLKSGGLYFIDWSIQFVPYSDSNESWTIKKGNIKVTTHYSSRCINPVEQLVEEKIILDVNDNNIDYHMKEVMIKRAVFPQEFLMIIEDSTEFTFVGWWNNWDIDQPLREVHDIRAVNRSVTLLRRK